MLDGTTMGERADAASVCGDEKGISTIEDVRRGGAMIGAAKAAADRRGVALACDAMTRERERATMTDDRCEPAPTRDDRRERAPMTDDRRERAPMTDDRRERATMTDHRHERATSRDDRRERAPMTDDRRERATTRDDRRERATTRDDRRERATSGDGWPEPAEIVATRLDARFRWRKRQLAAWDAEEARDLRDAIRVRLWEQFGCVTLVEYLEIRCGIEARTAIDRVRVAEALGELPVLEAELERGAFAWSHVRELVRVVVPETEEEWIASARGKSFKQVRAAVAGHVRGDRPGDPTKPDDERRWFGWELKPSTIARVKALVARLEAERGDAFVDDDDRVNAVCDAVEAGGGEKAPAQVWITRDGHVFAHGVELDEAEAAALVCDADVMGDVDDPAAKTTHAIAPRKRKRLLARDGHACRVPGCRAKRYLDLHHVVHREDGGDDSDDNLVTLCGGHHRLHHAGLLQIWRDGDGVLVFERRGVGDG